MLSNITDRFINTDPHICTPHHPKPHLPPHPTANLLKTQTQRNRIVDINPPHRTLFHSAVTVDVPNVNMTDTSTNTNLQGRLKPHVMLLRYILGVNTHTKREKAIGLEKEHIE